MRTSVYSAAIGCWLFGVTLAPGLSQAQVNQPAADVTFTKDIAPILQRSCQQCHRPDGGAPMSLITYEEVRPWARAMKTRTGLGPRAGVMPPWFVEKNIGIQKFKHDPSLSDEEIARIAKWADSGAPRGNPADMPPPQDFDERRHVDDWRTGSGSASRRRSRSRRSVLTSGALSASCPTGLTEDRYVSAVEVREVNDIPADAARRSTVGGRYVFHHMTYSSLVAG